MCLNCASPFALPSWLSSRVYFAQWSSGALSHQLRIHLSRKTGPYCDWASSMLASAGRLSSRVWRTGARHRFPSPSLQHFFNMSTLFIAKSDSAALQVLVAAQMAKFDVTPEATAGEPAMFHIPHPALSHRTLLFRPPTRRNCRLGDH